MEHLLASWRRVALVKAATETVTTNGRTSTWEDITGRHPEYDPEEGNEDHGWALSYLAHSHPGDPGANDRDEHSLTFQHEKVDPRHIDHYPHPADDPRVARARQGYRKDPNSVPPLLLVHRHGVYHVGDGHHRAAAAKLEGARVNAYVAYSPHEHEPMVLGDGEETRGASYGAEPHPGLNPAKES